MRTDISNDEIDQFIRVKRDTEKELHKEYNQNVIKSLKIYGADDKITFISQYTPLIFAKLNKADINALAESHEVESLYDMDSEPIVDDGLNLIPTSYQSNNRDTESYGVWQANTSVNLMRDTFGYTGDGIKIGLVQNNLPDFDYFAMGQDRINRLHTQFSYTLNHNLLHYLSNGSVGNDTEHANYMLSIFSGKVSGVYSGIAPDADVYCDVFDSNGGYYCSPIENLVAQSYYTYDRKQFIRYTPQQAGTYKIKVERIFAPGSSPAYYPEFALSYSIN